MSQALLREYPDLATAIDIYDAWIRLEMRRKRQPGLAVGLVHGGELLWGKGYGVANMESGREVDLDTRFRIASISKTFTAVAILQLRDSGAFQLDDPVAEHLDFFDLRYPGAPAITIRNLLTHTSGLPRDAHRPMWTECDAPDRDEFLRALPDRQPTRAPWHQFAYSNFGFSLLGLVVQQVSGLTWAEYLEQYILQPLGMKETRPVPARDDPRLATGYSRISDDDARQPMPFFLMNGFEASANCASSIRDLAKYAAFHLSDADNPALSPHSLRDMHRVHWLDDKWQGGYGLGSALYKQGDWTIGGHGGGYPGYLTGFTLCREHDFGIILLTNALGSAPQEYIKQGYQLVVPELVKARSAPASEPDPAWNQYLGEYFHDWGCDKVVIRDGKLQILSLDALDYPPVTLEPTETEHVFTLCEAGASNETARFELDEAGNAVKLWQRNEYAFRRA